MNVRGLARVLIAGALLAVAAGSACAAGPQLTRAQALQRLSDDDPARRREAVTRLGDVGTLPDAKALVERLHDKDAGTRSAAEEALWKVWSRSGDERVDALFNRGVAQMAAGRASEAIATFTRVIGMKPAFAEAWNKRATVYFLVGEHEKSLADCDEVMKRNPDHFGALAGYFQIHLQLEDYERALLYGRRALAVNPNMDGVRQGVEALEQKLGRTRRSI